MLRRIDFIYLILCATSPGHTSADNARLKEAFERYPEADANKDGTLTLEEAQTFKNKRPKEKQGKAMVPEGGWIVFLVAYLPGSVGSWDGHLQRYCFRW